MENKKGEKNHGHDVLQAPDGNGMMDIKPPTKPDLRNEMKAKEG